MTNDEPLDIRVVVNEFGHLLDVLGQQLDASLGESEHQYIAVGTAFEELAAARNLIEAAICLEPGQSILRGGCARLGESLDAAVIALQYHDRLAQRVGHIRQGLDHLQAVLRDGTVRTHGEWLELLRNVEAAQRSQQMRLTVPFPSQPDHSVELF